MVLELKSTTNSFSLYFTRSSPITQSLALVSDLLAWSIQRNSALFQTKVSCKPAESSYKVIFTLDTQRTVTMASEKQHVSEGHRATSFSKGIDLLSLHDILYIIVAGLTYKYKYNHNLDVLKCGGRINMVELS